VEGDLHDIGKNIVKSMLEASGLYRYGLGIDVIA
jgi:methanogenic corrinoid protein MtbC1